MNLSIKDLEQLLTDAVAAEAKVTRKRPRDVATRWALDYADAAVILFEQYRPFNKNARRLMLAARKYIACRSGENEREYERARSAFSSNPASRQYKAAILASQAIIEGTLAATHPAPMECVLRAALALREAEGYASRCRLLPATILEVGHEFP